MRANPAIVGPTQRAGLIRPGADNGAIDQGAEVEIANEIIRVVAAKASGRSRSAQMMSGTSDGALYRMTTGVRYAAFSAGFLRGWDGRIDEQRRPEFALMTGTSAGGVVAPIAFAGPEFSYLFDQFNRIDTKGVARKKSNLELLFS